MKQEKYIGMDVYQATISVAVLDCRGKLIMECILETKAATILEFIRGLQGSLSVAFEEGTSAAFTRLPLARARLVFIAGLFKKRWIVVLQRHGFPIPVFWICTNDYLLLNRQSFPQPELCHKRAPRFALMYANAGFLDRFVKLPPCGLGCR